MQHLKRAVALDPNHTGALVFLVVAYASHAGRPSSADDLAKRLVEIDPLTPLSVFVVGYYHWMAGRLEEALSAFESALALEPDMTWMNVNVAYLLVWMGRREEAVEKLDEIIQSECQDYWTEWAIFLRRASEGDTSGALGALSEDTTSYFWKDPDMPWIVASTYALAGAKDEALEWLEHAVDRGWINYPLFAEQDPLLENIRGEERFKELMVGVKARWESFEA